MASFVTSNEDNKAPSPSRPIGFRRPNARKSVFTVEGNQKLADYIILKKQLPRIKTDVTEKEKKIAKNMAEQMRNRKEAYRDALKDVLNQEDLTPELRLTPEELIKRQECIDGFEIFQRYIEHGSGKSMLEMDKSHRESDKRWWFKNIIPLLEKREKKQSAKPKEGVDDVTECVANLSATLSATPLAEDKKLTADLQKYYTKQDRIKKCIEIIKENLDIDKENDLIIEPSAGDGRWMPHLYHLCDKVVAYDIEPDAEGIRSGVEKMDFLSEQMEAKLKEFKAKHNRIHIIGNPPWKGVEMEFIRQCCGKAVSSISFILPATHMRSDHLDLYLNEDGSKHTETFHLPLNYLPIYKEFLQNEEYDGLTTAKNSCFILWECRGWDNERKKHSMPLLKHVINDTLAFEYLRYNDRKKANFKFSKIDAKCERHLGEEFDEKRFYYIYVPEQQLYGEPECLVKCFNSFRETKPDPFAERFYTILNHLANVCKYDILKGLRCFFKYYNDAKAESEVVGNTSSFVPLVAEEEEEQQEDDGENEKVNELVKVTAEDRKKFEEGGYKKSGFRKWKVGNEPTEGYKLVDEYFASPLPGRDHFSDDGYKTQPPLQEYDTLYQRSYKLKK